MAAARFTTVLAFLLAMLCAAACENTDPTPEEQQAVETAVRGYLFALAEAYSTLDINVLEGHASPNEIAYVQKLLTDLMSVFRSINATVRLVEVWDITRFGAADGIEKGRTENSIQNTLLQMRLVEGRWICIGRSIMSQETPIPDEKPSQTEGPI
jgi:hypothetical protein